MNVERCTAGQAADHHYSGDVTQPSDHAALVALLRTRPNRLTWGEIARQVLVVGSALDVWRAVCSGNALFDAPGMDEQLERAQADLDEWEASGLRFMSVADHEYPVRVRSIREVPPFLMARGQVRQTENAISVVGSRKASPRGLSMASAVADALVHEGYGVLSGLADGIDAAAHRSALAAGGRTVAIIGNGLNLSYPAINRDLQERIAHEGLLLSQFWPDAPPQRHNFLMRNAVMSGYGRATAVVEAGEHSGARAQARMAVEHGRPVILTDRVVAKNAWAKALVERPRVFVASSVSEVLAAVRAIDDGESAAAKLVARLVPEFA